MGNNKIIVRDVNNISDSIVLSLEIYDADLPEQTTETITTPAVIDEKTLEIIFPEKTESFVVDRPFQRRKITVPLNSPIEYIESLIKKEIETFKTAETEIIDKYAYFKNKIY